MKPYLITLLCIFTFCSYAQITIQTEYSNGLPNSNCIAEIDAEIIAVSNRKGKLVLENKYRNQEVLIKDLVTEIQWKFTVNQDTTIITQDIQLLDEVEIKPIDKVKLSKELFKVNQDRLPERLHIGGELYFAELYIIHHKDTTRLSDTLVEIFKCNVFIEDAFGEYAIFYKDPVKLQYGDFIVLTEDVYSNLENTLIPHKNVLSSIVNGISFDRFEVNKYRKLNSKLAINKNTNELQFFSADTTHFIFNTIGNEYKQSYDKSDSTYLFLSSFYKQGDPSKNILSFPFTHVEYSNPNKNYKEAYLTEELEIVMNLDLQGTRLNFKNSYFSYFDIDSVYTSKQAINAYEKTESLEKLIQETDVNSEEVKIRPKKIPLRFPEGILFR
ncbi:hypothetical protein [Brumimicrobium aurantiacum]|uniref:Uncharacterized protein n=1 Tax=Brumimicrobium aurantiacum TaxID=1737063 RepID=A0A3E1F0Z6_9FLAO|nr:hypothetical protein [Brumimicrobium aurantiacum]RFC55501.1 hypothetical protein DXU93_00780 [Brumimicrobium aurantiacum]